MTAFVYILQEGSAARPIKIGKATRIKSRVSSLQIGNFRELKLAGHRECANSASAVNVERAMHRQFSEHRIAGEWYDVDAPKAVAALSLISPDLICDTSRNIVDRLVSVFGSQAEIARICGVKQPSVAEWIKSGVIPARRQRAILDAAQAAGKPLTADQLIPSPPEAA